MLYSPEVLRSVTDVAVTVAQRAVSEWRFEWVTNWEEVWSERFTRRWQGWMAESTTAHVFFEPATARAWIDTFSAVRDVQPRFLVATRDPGTLVFLPLVRISSGWKDAWRRAIVPVGLPGFDYHDPILVGPADQCIWDGFWRGLEAELRGPWADDFDVALVNGLRSWSLPPDPERWLSGGLPGAARAGYQEPAPYIDLTRFGTIDDYAASVSSNLRQELRAKFRSLRKLGEVSLHYYSPDEVQPALAALETMLEFNRRRFPHTWRAKNYYANLIRRCLPTGTLLLSEMLVQRQPVGWELDFIYRRRLYKYIAAFDPAFARWSPGNLHSYLSLERAIGDGLEVYDFMRGNESYKARWATGSVPLFEAEWIGNGPLASVRAAWVRRVRKPLAHLKRTARHKAGDWRLFSKRGKV